MALSTAVLLAILLMLFGLFAWATNLISLPGNWIVVALLAVYALWGPEAGRLALGWPTLLAAFVVALLGEVFDFTAGAIGARRAGASRRAAMMAVWGSILGGLLGLIVGLPIPLIGSAVAAVLFGGIGATLGTLYGQWSEGRPLADSWPAGRAAFWGRMTGTVGKLAAGLLILMIAALGLML